jgi:hypothetical protein
LEVDDGGRGRDFARVLKLVRKQCCE